MLGNIKIYFGKVENVMDETLIYRCQISIKGYTDELEPADLPWYFPMYGVNYLPETDQIVPVIIFDDNFTTGFYGRVVGLLTDEGLLHPNEFSEDDYKHYLEIFKRKINDKSVRLTYNPTNGIEFENDTVRTQSLTDKWTLFVGANTITVVEDKIDIGNDDGTLERVLQGDKTVQELKEIIKHQQNCINKIYKVFGDIQQASAGSPYTIPISTAIIPHKPEEQILNSDADKISAKMDNYGIQSELVFTRK